MVDAALVGLDQGEVITIPPLPDLNEWTVYETARQAMASRFSNAAPAARYGAAISHAA
jgi:tRNA(Ile2) C34 agmatinyltransferase TiaS